MSACADPAGPGTIDPYAVFYIRDDRPLTPEAQWPDYIRTRVMQMGGPQYVGVVLPQLDVYYHFPNRTLIQPGLPGSIANSAGFMGSVGGIVGLALGQGRDLCGAYGMPTAVPGDPLDKIRILLLSFPDSARLQGLVHGDYRDLTIPGVDSTITSPTVDPFALGENTYETPHWFRLWLKADGTRQFDFGRWSEQAKLSQAPGWPCSGGPFPPR